MDAQNHGWWDQLPQGFIHPFLGKRRDNYHHFKVNFFIRRRIFCYRCRTAPFVLRQKPTRQWQAPQGIPVAAEVAWWALQWAFDNHFQLPKHCKMLLT